MSSPPSPLQDDIANEPTPEHLPPPLESPTILPEPLSFTSSSSSPPCPPITICPLSHPSPTVTHYINLSATIGAHANLTDPLTVLFEHEKHPSTLPPSPPSSPSTQLRLTTSLTATIRARLTAKLPQPPHPLGATLFPSPPPPPQHHHHYHHAFIIECGAFAATACWTPPAVTCATPPPTPPYIAAIATARPLFASFLTQIERARHRHLYPVTPRDRIRAPDDDDDKDVGAEKQPPPPPPQWGHAFYHLSLMARNPRHDRGRVKGAVRGVLEPVLRWADEQGVPVWAEAGSERARDVYAWFGLRVVEVVVVAGVDTWCMLKVPPGRGEGDRGRGGGGGLRDVNTNFEA